MTQTFLYWCAFNEVLRNKVQAKRCFGGVSPFEKGGLRGIFQGWRHAELFKSPQPPFSKGGECQCVDTYAVKGESAARGQG